MHIHKDLVSAASGPIILSILLEGDSYGYEIIKTVQGLSGGVWQWSEGMLYPVLHRMERDGSISSYWQKNAGRRRKYYRITEDGVASLENLKLQWETVNGILKGIWPGGLPEVNGGGKL